MPKATRCTLKEEVIDVEEAIALRDLANRRGARYPEFRCLECGEAVRPHKTGTTGQEAHFEHRTKQPGCSLSR